MISVTGHSFAAFRADVLIVYLRRLAFFIRRAWQVTVSHIVGSKGSFHPAYVRRAIVAGLADHLSVSGEA